MSRRDVPHRVGSRVTLTCPPHHKLIRSAGSVRTCQGDGRWSGDAGTCGPVDCGMPTGANKPDGGGDVVQHHVTEPVRVVNQPFSSTFNQLSRHFISSQSPAMPDCLIAIEREHASTCTWHMSRG